MAHGTPDIKASRQGSQSCYSLIAFYTLLSEQVLGGRLRTVTTLQGTDCAFTYLPVFIQTQLHTSSWELVTSTYERTISIRTNDMSLILTLILFLLMLTVEDVKDVGSCLLLFGLEISCLSTYLVIHEARPSG